MNEIRRAGRQAKSAAESAAASSWFELAARIGFVANGIVHMLLGGIALGIAIGGGGQADQSGAVQLLSEQPFGLALLWIALIGCAFLTLNYLLSAWIKAPAGEQGKHAVKSIARAIAYGAMTVVLGQFVFGQGSDSGESSQQLSMTIAELPGGLILLAVLGAAIAAFGVFYCIRGIRRKWQEKVRTPSSAVVGGMLTFTGVAGYIGKGITLLAVGVLIVVSALQGDPEEFTGIDGALKAMRDQAFGVPLLIAVSAGLILHGVFLMLRSRYDRMR